MIGDVGGHARTLKQLLMDADVESALTWISQNKEEPGAPAA